MYYVRILKATNNVKQINNNEKIVQVNWHFAI